MSRVIYELLEDDKVNCDGYTLYRIRATEDHPRLNIKKGDLGGYMAKGETLGLNTNGWLYPRHHYYGGKPYYIGLAEHIKTEREKNSGN